jgi:DNA invertase Pin-like site-specific DNA recombinase
MGTGIVQAAGYIRMSSDRQEDSVERQREQITGYCAARGITVTAWFIDEGIPGSDANLHRREGYRRMCADAKRNLFNVVVVDKTDRLSRADPLDFGATVKPLRDAGVRLETVNRGPVDWRDAFGQMALLFEQSGNNQYARTISYNVLSRLRQMAAAGLSTGSAPYGYKRGRDGKLTPDEERVQVVQWIFHAYAVGGLTVPAIVDELHRRGVASPRGKEWWTTQTIWQMLRNRAYVGDFVWNKTGRSEYHRLHGGEVRELGKAGAPDLIVVPDSHPPLIDRGTWEQAQARRARNATAPRTPIRGGGDWVLSGLLVCGHCGARMHGLTVRGRKVYLCGTYRLTGGHGCGHHVIPAAALTDFLVGFLQRTFLSPDRLAELRAALTDEAERMRRAGPAAAARIRVKLAKLGASIERGARRVLEADDGEIPELRQALAAMRAERADLERELAAAGDVPPVEAVEDEVRRIEAQLWRLREGLASADPALIRAVFQEMLSRVELHWEKRKAGHRKFHFTRGVLHLRQDDGSNFALAYYPSRPAGRR